jgi:hypothetical protein
LLFGHALDKTLRAFGSGRTGQDGVDRHPCADGRLCQAASERGMFTADSLEMKMMRPSSF